MKKLLPLLLVLILNMSAFGQDKPQSAYYDALFIYQKCFNKDDGFIHRGDLFTVLKKYYPTTVLSEAELKKNPFFKPYVPDAIAQSTDPNSTFRDGVSSFKLGAMNVTNIADGIAQFLIKRGKEELNAAFFNRLKKFLDDHDECKTLFPATTEFLQNIASYRYAELIQSLREAFHKDLSNLIVGLNQLIDLPKYQELLKNLPEIRVAVRSARVVSELSQSSSGQAINPADVIEHLAQLKEWSDIHPNLGNSWKLLSVISASIRNNDNSRIWIRIDELNSLINNPDELRIFLGLIYQSVQGIQFKIGSDSTSVQDFLAKQADNIYAASGLIENFATLATDIDRTIADFHDKRASGLSDDDYYTYINKAIAITEYGFKVANFIRPGVADNKYIIMAKNANDLYRSIYTKEYNNAIMNAYNILDQIFNHAQDLATEKIERNNLAGKPAETALMNAVKSPNLPDSKVIEGILKYGNFFASVVKAQSADEVESAIEAAALPAGSYSIKQRSSFNISVNGYIGYGWDMKVGHGIYAPVGFSLSKGLGKNNGGALTLFAAAIDVGSIVSYRLKNGNDDDLKQEVRLESIFAPSAQLLFEIPKTPIAFGPGWRRTPKLFYSNNTDFIVVNPKDVFNISVLIDIPIFTLKNDPYKN